MSRHAVAWGFVFGVVCGLQATQHTSHEGRGEAEEQMVTVVARAGARGGSLFHGGPGSKAAFALVGDFGARDSIPGHPLPSLRVQGQAAAAELLMLAMRAGGLSDTDLGAALDVGKASARRLRVGERLLAVGDLIILHRRLPSLAALVLGAFEPMEAL